MKCTNSATSSASGANGMSPSQDGVHSNAGMNSAVRNMNISTSSSTKMSNFESLRTDSGYNSSCSCQSISSSTFSERNLKEDSASSSSKSRTSDSLGDSGLVLDSVCESSLELNDLNKDSSSFTSKQNTDNCAVHDRVTVGCGSSSRSDSGLGLDFQESFSKLSVRGEAELEESLRLLHLQTDLVKEQDSLLLNRVQIALQTPHTPSDVIDNLLQAQRNPLKRLQLAQDAYFPDKDGDTHLHLAVVRGCFDIILALIYLAPHPSFLDLQNNLYQTALHLAVLTSQPKVVRRLVLAGASLDIRNRMGNTPLHLACERGELECVRELTRPVSAIEMQTMKHSCPLSYRQPCLSIPQNLEIRNYEGQMCVHLAAIAQYPEIIRHLKLYGANINAQEGKGGRTPLCFAIEARNCNLVEFLVKECQADINATTYAGITPFQVACGLDPKIAEVLSNLGAYQAFSVHSDSESDSDCSCDETMDTSEEFSNYFDLKINGEPLW